MTSYELEIDEKSDVGMTYMARVASELRRALLEEKATRKVTQQSIAEKVGTSRAVINREIGGLENITARRTAEILWALGWEPYFEARKVPVDGANDCHIKVEIMPSKSTNESAKSPKRFLVGV